MFRRLLSRVQNGTLHMFRRHLLLTNILITGSFSAVGDCVEQQYEKYKDPSRNYQLRRTFNMTTAGLTTGVVCHYWYIWLDDLKLTGSPLKIALKRVLLDQLINSPATIATFFITLAILEGVSLYELKQELRCKSTKVYLSSGLSGARPQLINFLWLPGQFQSPIHYTIVCLKTFS
ncbi:Mpv17-like protein 2 [Orchesella cincta]|uniref:Mpv17-like protein 2 n=1 Tax=Orchesella cincta TaxID=48709 RepID=A0A1D2M9I8_ORCCI|nr:Mpv17-like protein 2 [Orchesella cincta]